MASGSVMDDAIASSVTSKLSIHETTEDSESESEPVLSQGISSLSTEPMESDSTVQEAWKMMSFNAFTVYYSIDWKLLGEKREHGDGEISYLIGSEIVRSTTMPPILYTAAFTVSYGSGLYGLPDDDGRFDLRMLNYLGEVTDKFCELIKIAPNQTVDLIEAAKHLQVRMDLMYRVINFLHLNEAIAVSMPNKISWVFRYPPPDDMEYLRHLRDLEVQRRFEKFVRFLSDGKKKIKWRYLYLTEADLNEFVIKDSVGFQNDILMIVSCPPDINLEVPRAAAQDGGDGRQRKYGIIRKIFPPDEMPCYFVSKLESHDVVNLDETS